MHDNIYNEFVLDKATASGTDWVVTFPTKTWYYDKKASDKELKVLSLFQRNFKSTGACDDISLIRYDREEKQVKTTTTFSPPPTKTDSLCWESERHLVQFVERAGVEERLEPADDLRERLGRAGVPVGRDRHPADLADPRADRRQHDASRADRAVDRFDQRLELRDVLRPAGPRLRRGHVLSNGNIGGAVELRRQLRPQVDASRLAGQLMTAFRTARSVRSDSSASGAFGPRFFLARILSAPRPR